MVATNELEIENSAGMTYFDCFKGTDRRRTEIVMMVFAMQLLSGENLIVRSLSLTANQAVRADTSRDKVFNSSKQLGSVPISPSP